MGSCGSWPNFNAWYQTAWGAGQEFWSASPYGALSANIVFGRQNPPYCLDNFLAVYPKFFGLPTAVSGCSTTLGSAVINVPSIIGLGVGQFLQAPSVLPPGTVIVALGTSTITVNNNAIAAASGITLSVYQSPPIPVAVIQLYLNLAWSSLVQCGLWEEQWPIAMAWFIAHYLTLFARSDATEVMTQLQTIIHGEIPDGAIPGTVYTLSAAPPGGVLQSMTKNGKFLLPGGADYTLAGNTITLNVATVLNDTLYAQWPVQQQTFTATQPTGAAIAAQGLAGGIQTSKGVGDVSVGYSALTALEDWGQWNLTLYGQQLATMARVIGSGPALIW